MFLLFQPHYSNLKGSMSHLSYKDMFQYALAYPTKAMTKQTKEQLTHIDKYKRFPFILVLLSVFSVMNSLNYHPYFYCLQIYHFPNIQTSLFPYTWFFEQHFDKYPVGFFCCTQYHYYQTFKNCFHIYFIKIVTTPNKYYQLAILLLFSLILEYCYLIYSVKLSMHLLLLLSYHCYLARVLRDFGLI